MAALNLALDTGDDYRRKLAYALMQRGGDVSPVRHWTQGLARALQGGLGGYELGQIDKKEESEKAAGREALVRFLGGDGVSADPVMPPRSAGVVDAPDLPPDQPSPYKTAGMTPRNADDTFRTPLDARSPPASPMMVDARSRLAEGMRTAYNAPPTNTPPAMSGMNPVGAIPVQTQTITPPAPQTLPQAVAGAPPASGAAGTAMAPADRARLIAMLNNKYTAPMAQAIIHQQVSQRFKPPREPEWAPLGDEALYDKKTGRIMPAQINKRPTYGELYTDPDTGQPVRGWIDATRRETTPVGAPPRTDGQPSVIPPVPTGVDPKVWREAHSKRQTSESMPASSEDATKLRKEVQDLPSYKNLAQSAPVYKSMVEAAGRDNRAADVNLIYGMAKLMDPGSVVRESEMTIAQAIATMPQNIQAQVKSQLTATGRLDSAVRAGIMQEAHSRVRAYQAMFDQDTGMYRGIAQRGRMLEADVLPTFGPFDEYKAPVAAVPPDAVAVAAAQAEARRRGLIK